MPIARVSEVTASSRRSFHDAIAQGVAHAIARNMEGAVVQEQKVLIEDGKNRVAIGSRRKSPVLTD
jgi:hypothetical protein